MRKRQARRAAWRAKKLAEFRSVLTKAVGPKIMATTREHAGPIRVRASRRPVVMHQVHVATGEEMTTEQYRATFAGDGKRVELEFEVDPDSDVEIRKAAYNAAELAHGPTTRGWYLIKVEGINALGEEMVR